MLRAAARRRAESTQEASMARLVKDFEERRVELLQTARDLFQDSGYDSVSVQAITDAVGVAKGTFYHYFQSKEDLLCQLSDWLAEDFYSRAREVVEQSGRSALEELRALMGFVVGWKGEHRDLVMTYLHALYRDENMALRHKMEAGYTEKLVPYFAHILEQGVREGVFDIEDPQETSEVILSVVRHSLAERIAPLMLSIKDHPEHLGVIIAKVRAVEVALWRILGVRKAPFKLYDLDAVRRILAVDE